MSDLYWIETGRTPLLISIPHAGTHLPPSIGGRLNEEALALPDTDWHIERLYEFARTMGIGLLAANHSRYVIDLNRDPGGKPLYPDRENTGLCPTVTFAGTPVYMAGEEPGTNEIASRRNDYWQPYHDRLELELARLRERFGIAVLWDAHSIVSVAPRLFEGRLPDLNLGTANGASADPALAQRVMGVFAAASRYTSVCDGRFSGGYITRHYGRPAGNVHALQLEMAQAIYMDEASPYNYRPDLARELVPVLRAALEAALDWARDAAKR